MKIYFLIISIVLLSTLVSADDLPVVVIGASDNNVSFTQNLTDTLYSTINWSYNQSNYPMLVITNNNASWLSTYNSTYNSWAYNQTTISNSYTNEVNNSLVTWINLNFMKITNYITNIAFKNETNIFQEQQVFSKGMNVTGNITLMNDDSRIQRAGANTTIWIDGSGNVNTKFGQSGG